MLPYMQQRPQMIDAEVQRCEALTWVAELMDQAFDKHDEAKILKVQLINAMNTPQQAIHKNRQAFDCQ